MLQTQKRETSLLGVQIPSGGFRDSEYILASEISDDADENGEGDGERRSSN